VCWGGGVQGPRGEGFAGTRGSGSGGPSGKKGAVALWQTCSSRRCGIRGNLGTDGRLARFQWRYSHSALRRIQSDSAVGEEPGAAVRAGTGPEQACATADLLLHGALAHCSSVSRRPPFPSGPPAGPASQSPQAHRAHCGQLLHAPQAGGGAGVARGVSTAGAAVENGAIVLRRLAGYRASAVLV
jgi:hypothetical protein